MAANGRIIDRLPSYFARMNIIQNRFSSLDERTVKQLAKETQGMFGEELNQSVEEYLKNGKISNKASFPYRNPYSGEYPELYFNPMKLTKSLKKMGFVARYIPPSEYKSEILPVHSPFKIKIINLYYKFIFKCPIIFIPFIYPCFKIYAKIGPIENLQRAEIE